MKTKWEELKNKAELSAVSGKFTLMANTSIVVHWESESGGPPIKQMEATNEL